MNVFAGAERWDGPEFQLFGPEHRTALVLLVIVDVLLIKRFRAAGPEARRRMRAALTGTLWAQEISYHIWRAATRTWTPKELLPLHLCSVAVWASGLMLLTRSYRLYEVIYFIALTGGTIALLTPDAGRFGFPHYRFVQFFASHGLTVLAPLWMTFVEGYRPTGRSLVTTSAGVLLYGAGVFAINRRVGSNYLFVNRKPDTRSPLDLLPPWPGYLPIMAAAVLGLFGALYAPWAIADARRPA